MSTDQLNGTSVLVDVPNIATDHICATEDISTATVTYENAAPIMQRVKNSNLLRTSPIASAETKKRKRSAIDEDDYANAFADTTNIHNNSDAPLSPSESPTKKRKKLTDEEKAEREKQRLEREEKRQQELKEKEERRLKKEEERKQKETEREEQKLMREEEKRRKDEEKKKKEEDKEKLRLEREEEKRRKEEERKKKEEEKRKKDDERKKKEEDKRRKEEERERAEEDKKRQAEKKRAYWGQFKAATASGEGTSPHSLQTSREIAAPSTSVRSWSTELFRAWQPAVSAVIAPLHRWQARDLSSFEQQLAAQNVQVSVAALPKPPRATRRSVLAARKARRVAHYQQVIDLSGAADPQLNPLTDRLLHARFKYLNFHENVRPAYYGTFTAQCRHVTARRPLGKDERTFGDYEYDSDEDWEEEEGEDLDAMSERSEDEQQANTATKELEGEEDYCYDGEFLVADGYLSDEEGLKSDNDDDEDERDPLLTPADLAPKTEEQRARDAERRQERMKKMMAHKKRVAECQAVVAGPIYHPSSAEERVRALITCYPVELLLAQPIDPRTPLAEELDEEVVTATPNKAKVVPDALVPDLIRILHGASSRSHVIDAFHKLHAHISKRQIERKIVEIASRGQVDDGKQVWVVRPEIVARYSGSASQVLPNLEVKQSDTAAVSITQFFGSAPQSDLVHVSRESAVVDTCHSAPMVQ